ncbi:MAG TPA: adenylosuccinate synthase [Candidatus Methanofastidiosa archaeon]|nr:adenylosuccinate synthase [Candidatus Methanofastidiosa archaeon]HPR42009.1 adenylosuccinate synthase [Candidatus Methanofastidiosa archaeon]
MMISVILGTQWGDEAKGKLTDYYASNADISVRFQGGNNAGHTIVVDDDTFKLRLLSSGVVQGKDVVMGNGMVIDPAILIEEMNELRSRNVKMGKIYISERAHVIMPYHKQEDGILEELKGKSKAGTTRRGIGPCYSDKVSRLGIRYVDLIDESVFREKLDLVYSIKKKFFESLGHEMEVSKEDIIVEYLGYADLLRVYVTDTSVLLNNAEAEGKRILMEGAQATHLDIDFGIYPFNTSSNTVCGGVCTGAGIPPKKIGKVLGIVKAYTTRVGTGPVPTELEDGYGKHLAEKGHEFGTVTGRPRRCGWLDLMLVKYSHMLNGLDGIFITKLDVLNGLDKVKVCIGYDYEGQRLDNFPSNMEVFSKCVPIYKEFPGWDFEIDNILEKGLDSLPVEAKDYLMFIESELGIPLYGVSIGPKRSQTLILEELF